MEYLSIEMIFNILLYILLITLVIYLISINRKLNSLRSGGDGFKAVVVELNHATDNAQSAIQSLKLTVRDAEHGLDGNLKQARSIAEELKYLIEQAGLYGDAVNNRNLGKMPPIGVSNAQNHRPRVAQNKAKNFADTTLERVTKKKQSLPNPILPTGENRINEARIPPVDVPIELGKNLDTGHKEMALQRREEAMRAIAEKNNRTNTKPQTNLDRQGSFQPNGGVQNRAPSQNRTPVQNGRPAQNTQMTNDQQVQTNVRMRNVAKRPQQASAQATNLSLSEMDGRYAEQRIDNIERNEPQLNTAPNKEAKSPKIQTADERRQSLMKRLSETR